MNNLSQKQHSKKKDIFEDQIQGTIVDGYDAKGLRPFLILEAFESNWACYYCRKIAKST